VLTSSGAVARTLRSRAAARAAVTAVPLGWLLLFFLIPFLIVLKISFSEALLAMPPYAPLLAWTHERVLSIQLHLANYHFLFSDSLYLNSFLYSVKVAAISTLLCLAWLSDGAGHHARARGTAQSAAHAGDPAVLDLLPAACLRLDGLLKDDGSSIMCCWAASDLAAIPMVASPSPYTSESFIRTCHS